MKDSELDQGRAAAAPTSRSDRRGESLFDRMSRLAGGTPRANPQPRRFKGDDIA